MVRLEPRQRPTIEEVLAHPALWGAEEQLKNICDWDKSWPRGASATARRLERHAAAVAGMLGAEVKKAPCRPSSWANFSVF